MGDRVHWGLDHHLLPWQRVLHEKSWCITQTGRGIEEDKKMNERLSEAAQWVLDFHRANPKKSDYAVQLVGRVGGIQSLGDLNAAYDELRRAGHVAFAGEDVAFLNDRGELWGTHGKFSLVELPK